MVQQEPQPLQSYRLEDSHRGSPCNATGMLPTGRNCTAVVLLYLAECAQTSKTGLERCHGSWAAFQSPEAAESYDSFKQCASWRKRTIRLSSVHHVV